MNDERIGKQEKRLIALCAWIAIVMLIALTSRL